MEDNQCWGYRLDPKKIGARTFPRDFFARNFLGEMSGYVAIPVIVPLSLGHSDITRFCACHQSWQKIFWIAPKKFQQLLRRLAPLTFWSTFRHFGTHFAESFCMSKSSWMIDPTHSREIPSFSAIDLAEIQQSSKISSWIFSIISGVVTVLGRPGKGASQVEKSPRLNWAIQFLMVAYNGAYSSNVSCRMAWTSFCTFSCQKKNLDYSLRIHVVEIAHVAWHASFQPL